MKESVKFYNFFPYNYGPFSNMSYLDLNSLKSNGFLQENQTAVTEKGNELLRDFDPSLKESILGIVSRFNSEKEIMSYVYTNYPSYTVRSKIKGVRKDPTRGICTIGYEGRDIDSFLNALIENNVDIVIDIRNNPFSMKFSFTKEKLKGYLEKSGIGYIHMPELGVRSERRKELFTIEDYHKLFEAYRKETLYENQVSLKKIRELSKNSKVALLCFEHDHAMCHRGVVSEELERMGEKVVHL